jgi:hypothetical protein
MLNINFTTAHVPCTPLTPSAIAEVVCGQTAVSFNKTLHCLLPKYTIIKYYISYQYGNTNTCLPVELTVNQIRGVGI